MADFIQTRTDLVAKRQDTETARLALLAANQQLRMLQQQRTALDRQKGDNNPGFVQRSGDLDKQIDAGKEKAAGLQKTYAGLRDGLVSAEQNFTVFADPRRQLESGFAATTPFLLFPLRMETRFKTVNGNPQLWVRVYPDECLVDSFEPLLSRQEVNNGARFWAAYYGAGQPADPVNPDATTLAGKKAAWRMLSGVHGGGRAAWITRQLKPDAATSIFPVGGDKTLILAIQATTWDPAKQAAIFGLFEKLWLADGDAQQIESIKNAYDTANPGLDADTVISDFQPLNFGDQPPAGLTRADVTLAFAVVVFSDLDSKIGKENSWSQPTRVNLMPERLALIRVKNNAAMEPIFGQPIPFPIPTSPDPSPLPADPGAPPNEPQFQQTPDGDLVFADSVRWVADFDRAVSIGMGFRVDLAKDETGGFQRLMVLGVKLSADADIGSRELADLLDHHYFSNKGFSIVPQGTATNNTDSSGSGYTSLDDPDKSFDKYFLQKDGFSYTADWNLKSDGQWLAEWLGLDDAVIKKVLYSDGLDQADARNMNTALWPATLGYVMESLMKDGFSTETIAQTRDFFNAFVSGRGPVPAIRIGTQPYGILPTAAFRRLQWMNPNPNAPREVPVPAATKFAGGLYQLLLRIDGTWTALAGQVSHLGAPTTDAYKTLLDIIGLHPNSVEFHRRYLESLEEISNAIRFFRSGFLTSSALIDNVVALLSSLGYPTNTIPQLAHLLALPTPYPVKVLIDDSPLSEINPIRAYTADGKNYITALLEEARASENALRTGDGLQERPEAELYRLLKYALELGYHNSAVNAVTAVNAFPATQLATMRVEHPFIHQQWEGAVTESRYALLYETVPAITPAKTVAEFIRDSVIATLVPVHSQYLAGQLKALDALQNASTARLERALAEHTDCCSYRLDAWKTGILTDQLTLMRQNAPSATEDGRRKGIFLGAFGWLENVAPEMAGAVRPVQLPSEVVQEFNPRGDKVFLSDTANEGYIHAPSLNQAVTAAVLRNGYISHGKPDNTNVLSVNLSSERIRMALSIIEGIQGGQSLAALLGYQFERSLHDRDDLTAQKIDSYVYAIRKLFPLNSDQIKDTQVKNNTDPSVDQQNIPITAIEARNVVHGQRLADWVRTQTGAGKSYPFQLGLPSATLAVAQAITDSVNQIIDMADALADLGMAESVHHALKGNMDRAAGVLDSYSKGNYPQAPEVIRTPRSGTTLTHRVGIPFDYVALAAGTTPRAQGEPSMNQWLGKVLPGLDGIVCVTHYDSLGSGPGQTLEISLQDIGLQPIDLLYVSNTRDTSALNELDDRFLHFLYDNKDVSLDSGIHLAYTETSAVAGRLSVFEIMPLLNSLRVLLIGSTSLTPTDLALPNEADKKDSPSPELPAQRIKGVSDALKQLLSDATTLPAGILNYLSGLPDRTTATDAQLDAIVQQVDDTMEKSASFLLQLGSYGILQTGSGSLYTQRQQWFIALITEVKNNILSRWQVNADNYSALLTANPAPDTATLQSMDRLITATATPADTITLAIVQAHKTLFDTALGALNAAVAGKQASLHALITDIQAVDTRPFDVQPLDISGILVQIVTFVYDLQARAAALLADLQQKRLPAIDQALAGLPVLLPADQVTQIQTASKQLFGDAFTMIPRYSLPAAQQAEIGNSWGATGPLLDYLVTTGGRGNPLEDWLHGMARVHDKMKHLENCLLLREAFGLSEDDLALHPVQLPFLTSSYHWMALPFPEADSDAEGSNVLLYTSFTAAATTAPTEVCGLRVDEWVELIPAREETTGIAFNYNRPNAEAPQALLLVTPTQLTGNWQWNDLVDALSYTLDAVRSRGVEPDQVDTTAFASLLPAVLAAESLFPYSIVLDNKAHYLTETTVKNIITPKI